MPASDLKIETRIGVKRKPRRILSIVSNTAQLKGFPVGFFAEEMTRAFLMFTEAGHQVDIASPKGGEVMFDTHSDPRTPGGAYADDLVSLGFVHHAKYGAMLKNTLPISALSVDDYDAVWVAGGGGPLLTFKDDTALHALIASFYEKGKIVTLICHGSSLLLWTRLSNGELLADGKKWTGFTDEEEEKVNAAFGMTLNEYTIKRSRRHRRDELPLPWRQRAVRHPRWAPDHRSAANIAAGLPRTSFWRLSTNNRCGRKPLVADIRIQAWLAAEGGFRVLWRGYSVRHRPAWPASPQIVRCGVTFRAMATQSIPVIG